MPRPPFTPSPHPGTLHHFTSRLVAFEHGGPSPSASDRNVLIWIGGLGDGLLTVPYPQAIAASLPPNWCLVQPVLYSSYIGWGASSLKRDAKELGRCVEYFKSRRPGAKIVLMGHSTGSQDCMEYLVGAESAERPGIDGVILQAGISDREGMIAGMPDGTYEASCKTAQQWVDEGRGGDFLPLSVTTDIFVTPCTASRWLSLASPDKNGADDYFSSDLDAEKLKATFGRLPKESPLLILFGGADPFVPQHVDRRGLVAKWTDVVKRGGGVVDEENGGIVEGATHNLSGDPEHVVQDLVRRVKAFLEKVDQASFVSSAHL
ncbi:DUF1749-domain-containing protein [Rhizodiscina lignyota]|uniref:DUF1749-domain-containing protein n=1 Tax=Rhizodiscina lignyota TaxID=1504668 RepID=A0A9P4INY2_9PEZI|nr:DUF1749-domain-containing protein [Rhizodiscina lignyota]